MAEIIEVSDLPSDLQTAELVDLMVAGANASASRVAPCLAGTGEDAPTDDQVAEAKLVLVGAVKRWCEAGSGAFQQQTAGPFSVATDSRQRSGFNLWPSEIERLQELCVTGSTGGAFEIDTLPANANVPGGIYGEDYWWTGPDSFSTDF